MNIMLLKKVSTTFLSWSEVVKVLMQLIFPKCQDSISVIHTLSALPASSIKVQFFKEQEALFSIYINFI